jgi:hypothetical protein
VNIRAVLKSCKYKFLNRLFRCMQIIHLSNSITVRTDNFNLNYVKFYVSKCWLFFHFTCTSHNFISRALWMLAFVTIDFNSSVVWRLLWGLSKLIGLLWREMREENTEKRGVKCKEGRNFGPQDSHSTTQKMSSVSEQRF